MKKVVSMLLVAVLLLSTCMVGCNNTPDIPEEEDPTGVSLVTNGVAEYIIVRGENATADEINAAKAIRAALQEMSGTDVQLTTDYVKAGEESSIPAKEILVGECNREETKSVAAELAVSDYTIQMVGEKIVVLGYTSKGTTKAANYLIANCLNFHERSNTLLLNTDQNIKHESMKMTTLELDQLEVNGITGELAEDIIENWLIGIRETNPAILDMFADRDKEPYREVNPWSGEFAGKYLTSAYYIYTLTRNEELRIYVEDFIDEFISYQAEDGYLGCFQEEARLTGGSSSNPDEPGQTNDAWAHYHAMYGLYMWYKINGNESYMETIHKIAELFDATFFGDDGKRLVDTLSPQFNLAPYHVFALLANETGDPLYLKLAREIEEDIEDERAGQFFTLAETETHFYEGTQHSWENMHTIMGIVEMSKQPGCEDYLDTALWLFESIMSTDIHNTGAFSTGEHAIGNPYTNGVIETCCVVAFNALASQLYLETGRTDIVDFLEQSHYNAVLGSYNPTGYWSTYSTPMEGTKCANFHSEVSQSKPGAPNLNCCSVNAPRGVGQVTDWMLVENDGVIYINLYESLVAEGDGFSIEIESNYPAPGQIKITIKTDSPRKIALRIPSWSATSTVTLDGQVRKGVAGEYLMLPEMQWNGNELTLELDFSVRVEQGGLDYAYKYSIYYGPILFGCDTSLVDCDVTDLPAISREALESALPEWREDGRLVVTLNDGIVLSDFRTLGMTGSYYVTYVKLNMKE